MLNNKDALEEIQKVIGLRGVIFEGELKFTKQQLISFFEITNRTIYNCLSNKLINVETFNGEIYSVLVFSNYRIFTSRY